MSTPATLLSIYFVIGLLLMAVAVAIPGKVKIPSWLGIGITTQLEGPLLFLIALIWPVWLIWLLRKKNKEQ